MSLSGSRVVVIGAGVAGLACAIDLARQGASVSVVEAAQTPGGKMRQLQVAGQAIDSGPTVLTMRWVFDELFRDAGLTGAPPVDFVPANLLARHAWMDGSRLDLFADVDASAEAIAAFAGRAEADAYRTFAAHTERIYRTVEGPFLRSQRPSFLGLLREATRIGVAGLAEIDGMTTLWKSVRSAFRDPRLCQLFGRYATYSGSSPFEAPGTLALIAHVEREGVYHVRGGMFALAQGLARVAEGLGVSFHYGERVTELMERGGAIAGVITEGRHLPATAVVYAGDIATLASGRLGAVGTRAAGGYAFPLAKRSLSALTYSVVAEATGFPLARHNVFFSRDYAAEFRDLFERARLPQEPTVYVCAQDRGDGAAPATDGSGAAERLFMIVNAPATGNDAEVSRCESAMNQVLEASGLRLRTVAATRTTPRDFETLFPATGGALYGLASHGPMSVFKRPNARTPLAGFYLASGSAHPGAGVPMAALSGRLAARALTEDSASTRRSRTTATAGSISTA